MSELRELARYCSEISLVSVPEHVVSAAKYCILDSLGVAVGAANHAEIPHLVHQILSFTEGSRDKGASVWGNNCKCSVNQAIFLNGIMGHALELDDVHVQSKTHIGTVVLPAAWSLAESIGASGKELLESVIAGYEALARIGKGFGVTSHRLKGWHVTGTAGTFGAAAACAKLLKLTSEQTLNALGMAGTQSSGLWAFLEDGASCKKLHPGRAAVNGFVAALMAKGGMTGPEHILDACDGGLYRATSDAFNMKEVAKNLGTTYEILFMDKKPYPCCRSTHCAIDAILSIVDTHRVSAEHIESMLIKTYDIGMRQCGSRKYPRTSVEAKFSTPYVVASALVNGRIGLEHFTENAVNDARLRDLANKIVVESSEKFTKRYPEHWGCSLKVALRNGRVFTHEVADASGSVHNPLTVEQAKTKFMELVAPVLGEANGERIMNQILMIECVRQLPSI